MDEYFVVWATALPAQAPLSKPSRTRHPYTLQPSNPPPIPLPAPSSGRAIRPSSAHPEPRRGPPHRQTPSLHSQTTAHRLDPASIPSILPLTPNQQRPPLKRRFPHLAPSASRRARPRPRPASTHRTAPRHARRLVWFAKPNRTSRQLRRCAATRTLELPLIPAPRTGFCSRHVAETPPELSACASSSAASPERGRRPPARPPARVGWRTTGAVLAALNAGHASGDASRWPASVRRAAREVARQRRDAPLQRGPAHHGAKQHQAVVVAPLDAQASPRAVRQGVARDRQFPRSAPRREEPAREAEAMGGERETGGRARSRWRCESRRGRGGADGGEGGR